MDKIYLWLQQMAIDTRLEVFVVVGSLVEELVGPIPSPFIMTTAAIIAQEQGYPFWEVLLVTFLAAFVKTIMAIFGYFVADKASYLVVGKWGKYVGISSGDVEGWGKILKGKWWDDLLLLSLRAIPIFPTLLVTLACGFVKYPKKAFISMTFWGIYLRSVLYVWIGYFGYGNLENMYNYVKDNLLGFSLTVLFVGVVLSVAYWFREKIVSKFK